MNSRLEKTLPSQTAPPILTSIRIRCIVLMTAGIPAVAACVYAPASPELRSF